MRTMSLALALSTIAANSVANAVTYQYVSPPLVSSFGTTGLVGHTLIFDFTTYNPLPENLVFLDDRGLILPYASIPIINWSVSVGPYQATGVGNPAGSANGFYELVFDTNSVGTITGWYFYLDSITTDMQNEIAFQSELVPSGPSEGAEEYVQINPNINGAGFTAAAHSVEPGGWTVLDSTVIPGAPAESIIWPYAAIPEPSTWAMMLLGFAGLGFAGYRQRHIGSQITRAIAT